MLETIARFWYEQILEIQQVLRQASTRLFRFSCLLLSIKYKSEYKACVIQFFHSPDLL